MLASELEQRNARLAAIVDSSQDAIISKDLNGHITSWNKAAERMFGYNEQEVLGKHISILIPKERLSDEDMIISKLRRGERIDHYETQRVKKGGKLLTVSLTVSPIIFKDNIIGASKIVRDITEEKENEAHIKRNAQQLELIHKTMKEIGSDLDVQSIIQKITDATTQIAGAAFGAFFYYKVDSKGETLMLYSLSGASRSSFDKFGMPRNTEVFKRTFEGEGIFRSDDITKEPAFGNNAPYRGLPPGHLPVVSYLAVPVFSQTGIVIGGLFFGHPEPAKFNEEHENMIAAIAVHAAIAVENAKLYEEIKALNSKKDEFIGFASHELKTPLTTLKGYLQLAESDPTRITDFLPKINKQTSKLYAIISDLLDISRIEANKLNLNFSSVSLLNFMKECVDASGQTSDTHRITCELPKEDVAVTIDAQKMGQVIANLLSNAIKYSPGKTKIELKLIRLGGEIEISVKDEGMGIPAIEKDNIFNRFYRIPGSRSKADGLGVGLFIAQEIIEAHRGKIWVESEEGKGAEFFLSFPIEQVATLK